MADQPVQTPNIVAGAVLAHNAAANGDQFINNGRTWLSVKNGDSASHTVTVTCVGTCSYGLNTPAHDVVVAIAAGAERIFGPFDPTRFNDGTGRCSIVYSALTSMTVAVLST